MYNFVTGEKIQQKCDIYLGFPEDFNYNPIIAQQTNKHLDLNELNNEFDNPYLVFCNSHRILDLLNKIYLFKNNFILVTHNSDGEIRENNDILKILNCEKLDRWYAQNICFENDKLIFLPIGIANSMWSHGNLNDFTNEMVLHNISNKSKDVYFNFNINTNRMKRENCFHQLKDKLEWLDNVSPFENIIRLSQYKFCICPEGNGVDTHRLWECFYLKVVPIVIKSEFTNILIKQGLPIFILENENWYDLDINKLNYTDFDFNHPNLVNILNYNNYFEDI
jgi:hypothetical protein